MTIRRRWPVRLKSWQRLSRFQCKIARPDRSSFARSGAGDNMAGNLPDVPPSWNVTLGIVREIVVALGVTIAAIGGTTAAIISGCNHTQNAINHAESVQRIDEVKSETKTKLDSIEKKTDDAKQAAQKAADK
jgi:hypothetical protein